MRPLRGGVGIGIVGLLIAVSVPVAGSPSEKQQLADSLPGDDGSVAWALVRRGGGFTSPRGTTGGRPEAVASNGERFIAVGDDGTIVSSDDGDHWVEASGNSTRWFKDVAWGAGRFVAVAHGEIVHSPDGGRWRSASVRGGFDSVARGSDRFVAVGWNGTIMHSRDGDRWTPASDSATSNTLLEVTWGGDRFVAVGQRGTIVHSR